ncbi:MAG TPA: hypothetical protein PKV38_18400, partial [bacterium]|nr:hypothetical protein [bacterium]
MCNYQIESRYELQRLQPYLQDLPRLVGPAAYQALLQAVHRGHIRPGHDLYDGRPLPESELRQGHYMSPWNFQRFLQQAERRPHR